MAEEAAGADFLDYEVGSVLKVVEGADELLVVDHDPLTHVFGLELILHALVGRDVLFERGSRRHVAHRSLLACRLRRPGTWRSAPNPRHRPVAPLKS